MDIKFEPLQDLVLIQPIPKGETSGGIALPDGAEDPEEPAKGIVVKVGPGVCTEFGVHLTPNVKPGDMVYMFFVYTQPLKIRLDGKEYALVKANSIVAVIPQDEDNEAEVAELEADCHEVDCDESSPVAVSLQMDTLQAAA